jgi:hypothetical protein
MAAVTVTRTEALEAASHASAGDMARAVRLTAPRVQAAEEAHDQQAAPAKRPWIEVKQGDNPDDIYALSKWWLRPVIAVVAIAAVFVAWGITVAITHDTASNFSKLMPKPVTGTTIFAVFFVAAAGIERLLEPIAGLLPDRSDLNDDAQSAKVSAGLAIAGGKGNDQVKPLLSDAAKKTVKAKEWVFAQTVGFWALATILSVIASALLRLYLPYVVGIASGGRAFQILATGLIIGGGTKPLHDLVGYMSAAKQAKETVM